MTLSDSIVETRLPAQDLDIAAVSEGNLIGVGQALS